MPTVTFTGKSGNRYEFNVYPRETSFKDVGGVYVFSSVNSQGYHTPLYIGQTRSLEDRRLTYHEKWECAHPLGGDTICTHREDNEARRLRIERDLINAYNPACNNQ